MTAADRAARAQAVAAIRREVAAGRYRVPAARIADAIIDHLRVGEDLA